MFFQFEKSGNSTKLYIYLDNNLFRRLQREESFWNNVMLYIETHMPALHEDVCFIFTWLQFLEACDLGVIINDIKAHPDWKPEISDKKSFQKTEQLVENLEDYYSQIVSIIKKLPSLQKEALLDRLKQKVAHAGEHAMILKQETWMKVKREIESEEYMHHLANEIAWSIISSAPSNQPIKQRRERKDYVFSLFNSLIALGYKIHKSGSFVNLYRLFDRRYLAHCYYIAGLNDTNATLKEQSDLCDGEQLDYAYMGHEKKPVVAIAMADTTRDKKAFEMLIEKTKHRMQIMKGTHIALKRDVKDWDIKVNPGKILCLHVQGNEVIEHVLIDYRDIEPLGYFRWLSTGCKKYFLWVTLVGLVRTHRRCRWLKRL